MQLDELKNEIDQIDIYLLDQILKERYTKGTKILDVGCGTGRNLKWFYNNSYPIYGIDISKENIKILKEKYNLQKENFSVNKIEKTPFESSSFNHVICCAVLHFATNEHHFFEMFTELIRILKVDGTLFIRVASDIGLEKKVKHLGDGVYKLPDGTDRFLLNPKILKKLISTFDIKLIERVKTTNVEDLRCMTTLMFQKI